MVHNKFVGECKKVSEALSNVLEIQLVKAKKADLGLIGLYYGDLERGFEIGNDKLVQRSLERLKRLLGELVAAKAFYKHKNYNFSEVIQKLCSNEPSNSFGIRAELMMLSLLLEDITKRESPDYFVNTPKGDVYLEVTHVHIRKAQKDTAGYKIAKAVRTKSEMPYANRKTALFLDITNIAYREIEARRNPDLLRTYAAKTLQNSQIGAVILMQGAFNLQGKYIPLYQTFLHSDASEALAKFLNRYYPCQLDYNHALYYPVPTT